jgi:hypothetical protein
MLTMLSVVDVVVSWYCITEVIEDFHGMGGGGMVLFASEVSPGRALQRTLPQAVLTPSHFGIFPVHSARKHGSHHRCKVCN